jgi:hypothetical protein
MAVISMMRMSGDPDELADRIERHIRPVGQRLAPKHGGLGTILARTDDGVLAINLWKSEEGRHAMAQEAEIQEAVAAAGLPQPHFESFEILSWELRPEALEEASV